MGHNIHGFVAPYGQICAAAPTLHAAWVCRLGSGLGFLPVTEDVAPSDDPASGWEFLDRLTAPMADWAAEQSRHFSIAYIQTEYFGGTGSQDAIIWQNGTVEFGPFHTADDGKKVTPLSEGAINQALRQFGVERGAAIDEFQAVGLHRYRDNEDWVAAARGTES